MQKLCNTMKHKLVMPAIFKNVVMHLKYVCIFLLIVLPPVHAFCQNKDDNNDSVSKKSNNILKLAMNAVRRTPVDSAKESTILNSKGETQYLPYKGKVIRNIYVQIYGFERNFADTAKPVNYYGTKLLNNLHRDTREWVIRNNIFIKPHTPVDPYILMDNERHLRTLEFIQDARIIIKLIPHVKDSVDVYVITKDLFSLTGELNDFSTNRIKAKVSDANVAGMGQKIQVTTLWEKDRRPGFGYELFYSKNNIAHTFINATAVYSKIRPDITYGKDAEQGWYINLERPLVSQYSHMAGALTIGNNQSINSYKFPDEFFYRYHYHIYDAWIGYNLGVKKFPKNDAKTNHFFVSGRYLTNQFTTTPTQLTNSYNFRYDNRQALLAQFTFFRQNFYKTNYIFGFGTTEDIPYGYNIAVTTGWYKQKDLSRPYAGIDANRYIASGRGYFFQYYLRAGGFLNNKKIQDAGILAGGTLFSPLFLYNNVKIRQFARLSYTKQFNRVGLDPLQINNSFGVRYFSADSVLGDERVSFHSETFFFLKYKFFGFKFAPFAFADVSAIKPEKESFAKTGFYYGLGGGVRMRNENLIFNTIELRAIYFPRKVQGQAFKVNMAINIRFRYNSNYVKAPDIIQLNSNDINNVF